MCIDQKSTSSGISSRLFTLIRFVVVFTIIENLYFTIRMVATYTKYRNNKIASLNKRHCLHENYNRTNSPDSNFFDREAARSLRSLNRNCSWHVLTIFVLNSFVKINLHEKFVELQFYSQNELDALGDRKSPRQGNWFRKILTISPIAQRR